MSLVLENAPPEFSAKKVQAILSDRFGVTGTAVPVDSERDQNFRVDVDGRPAYVLKISNSAESPGVVEFENAAFDHLRDTMHDLPIPRLVRSVDGEGVIVVEADDGKSCLVRLITWLDGCLLKDVQPNTALRRELGAVLARLGVGLRGFFHPDAARPLLWDITRLEELRDLLASVDDESTRDICKKHIDRFARSVMPQLKSLRSQVIYNDLNPSNVLLSIDEGTRVSGIIDFGDMVYAPLVCDVAIASSYQLTDDDDPLEEALEFIAAYHRVTPLEQAEIDVLPDLIFARLVARVVISWWRVKRHAENEQYIMRSVSTATQALARLEGIDPGIFTERIRAACPPVDIAPTLVAGTQDTEAMIARRQCLLGSAYRLFYDRPVHAVRGEGVWLFGPDGEAYLDAYNNVALVGHCQPSVVAALATQAATLNTHTRYLHDNVLEYAERLLELFPPALNRVMFGCTGSEANELALRLAQAYTGNQGVITTKWAYHGNTTSLAQVTSSINPAGPRADWVEFVAAPDVYRLGNGDAETTRDAFLAEIDAAIDRLAQRGVRPAALLIDAGFTCDGMHPPPPGALVGAAKRIRAAGGIYIADEVQAGFGRLGNTLWGFERDGLVPEIATLGKPIGNGHPLAATVVQAEVLDAFSTQSRYFNTFGGNPVSAAVGLAVLEVFQRESLADNSLRTGRYLRERLADLGTRYEAVGDVRCSGLFAGVEFVKDRESKEPAAELTAAIVNAMREQSILISSAGPSANILKIRPPMPFRERHVDQLVEALDKCMDIAKVNSRRYAES